MVSPLIGSLNHNVELLRIETNLFNLYIQGKPYHPTVEAMQLHRQKDGSWLNTNLTTHSLTSLLNIEQILMFSPDTATLNSWKIGDKSYPIFFETQSYELVIEKKKPVNLSFHHENINIRKVIKPLGQSILSGVLNFQNEVGLTDLVLQLEGENIFQLQIEIFPSKIDYKDDYQAILNDVNRMIYNLSFDFLRKTYHMTGLRETNNQSLTEFFTIFQHVFKQLIQAIERIQKSPNYKSQKEYKKVEAAKVRKSSKENNRFLTKNPHFLQQNNQHGFISVQNQLFLPSHALEAKNLVLYDTLENRFVCWVLNRILSKLKELKSKMINKSNIQDPLLLKKIDNMQNQLQHVLRYDFLNVGDMRQMSISIVLQMAPGYREVYKYYLILMKGLTIQSDLFRISTKDLAQLYEYWCFLKIHDLLSSKYELINQDIVKVHHSGIFVTLDKSSKARVVYRNPSNGEVFTLHYNSLPVGDHGAILGQKPDNVLSLKKNESAIEYKYIFDAKYRLNPAYEGTSYQLKYKQAGPEEEDINTMHRYRDAIVYSEKQGNEYERSMFGAYVLFPYQDEEQFKEHRFYKSIKLINVGAFPFLPNSTKLMEKFLDEIILDSPEKAYERSLRPRGTKKYYEDKLTGRNMLVGSLRGPTQLETALNHNFYHVPLENIINHKVLGHIEYIGLYQSKKKFGMLDETGIHWYGRILDWQVIHRREINEISPRAGSEEKLYVKFTVEQWMKRSTPIVSGGRGIHRLLYTSKYIFDRALEIAELKLDKEEDITNWRELRREGKVKVELDHDQVDLAKKIMKIEGSG